MGLKPSARPVLSWPELQPGAVIAGRYRVENVLGAGGMGVVVMARHITLDAMVAIKFLLREVAGDPEAVSRFAREAWTASRVKSEYVVRVTDIGALDDGVPFLVMDYLNGMDLAGMVRMQGQLQVEQAVEFMLQACEAAAEAHALGVVHRDLKPSNLFCVRRSDGLLAIKVLDFGISKLTQLSAAGMPANNLTNTARLMGSPLYMSPEQMSAPRTVDARADIWALGVILYELITGEVPFFAATLPDLAIKIATEVPASMRTKRPDVPKGLEQIAARCLERDRTRRYSNVGELARALAPFGPVRAEAHADRAERVLQTAAESSLPGRATPTSELNIELLAATSVRRRAEALRLRRMLLPLAAALGGVLLAGLTLSWWWRADSTAEAPARQASQAAPTPQFSAPQPSLAQAQALSPATDTMRIAPIAAAAGAAAIEHPAARDVHDAHNAHNAEPTKAASQRSAPPAQVAGKSPKVPDRTGKPLNVAGAPTTPERSAASPATSRPKPASDTELTDLGGRL